MDLFSELFVPFKSELKKELPGGKGTYVEWHQYVTRAHATFPDGYSKLVRVSEVGGQLVVTVRITDTRTGNYQEALGAAPADKTSWGGACTEAESQALRRAFANWGLGLEMYMDDDQFAMVEERLGIAGEQKAEEPANEEPEDDDPTAMTERQVEVLRVIGGLFNSMVSDESLDAHGLEEFLDMQRMVLGDNPTKKQAGQVVRAFREELERLGLEDPTKAGGNS